MFKESLNLNQIKAIRLCVSRNSIFCFYLNQLSSLFYLSVRFESVSFAVKKYKKVGTSWEALILKLSSCFVLDRRSQFRKNIFISKYLRVGNNKFFVFNSVRVTKLFLIFKSILVDIFFYKFKLLITGDSTFKDEVLAFNENHPIARNNLSENKIFYIKNLKFSINYDTVFMKLSKERGVVFIVLDTQNNVNFFLKRWGIFSIGFMRKDEVFSRFDLTVPVFIKNLLFANLLINYVYYLYSHVNNILLLGYFNYLNNYKNWLKAI